MRGNKNYYYSKIISKNIRKFKYLLGLDTETFAARCGLTPERVRELEDGKDATTNAIDLLRVAEGCNVRYEAVFESDDEKIVRAGFNVKFPPTLFRRLENWWIKKGKNRKWVAEKVGVGKEKLSQWTCDRGYPSPVVFSNLVALFNLRACDLEKMLEDESLNKVRPHHGGWPKKVTKEEPKPLPKPRPELLESEESCNEELKKISDECKAEEEQPQPDAFEIRMLKVMRLQKDIDSLMNQTKAIMSIAYDLYKALEKLK